jgi:hypothetical protein
LSHRRCPSSRQTTSWPRQSNAPGADRRERAGAQDRRGRRRVGVIEDGDGLIAFCHQGYH